MVIEVGIEVGCMSSCPFNLFSIQGILFEYAYIKDFFPFQKYLRMFGPFHLLLCVCIEIYFFFSKIHISRLPRPVSGTHMRL